MGLWSEVMGSSPQLWAAVRSYGPGDKVLAWMCFDICHFLICVFFSKHNMIDTPRQQLCASFVLFLSNTMHKMLCTSWATDSILYLEVLFWILAEKLYAKPFSLIDILIIIAYDTPFIHCCVSLDIFRIRYIFHSLRSIHPDHNTLHRDLDVTKPKGVNPDLDHDV
jgi:hypothetical protein